MITSKRVKPITKKQLQKIAAARASNNLQVVQGIAEIVSGPSAALDGRSYTEILRLRADGLTELCDHLMKNEKNMEAVQSDWRSVKRAEIDRFSKQENVLTSSIQETTSKIDSKEVSETLVTIHEPEVTESARAHSY